MAKKQTTPTNDRPTLAIVIACLVALVALVLIDSISPEFTVDKLVYAIIAGVLFGVGGVRDLFTGGKK